MRVVKVEKEKIEAVSEIYYLGEMLSAGSGCEPAAVTPCKCDKGKFCYLPPHQPQSAPCGQRKGVFIMCKECDAACSRDLDHDRGYTEQYVA